MLQQAKAAIREFSDWIDKPPSQVSMKNDSGMNAFQAIISCESLPAQEKQADRIAQEAYILIAAASVTTAVVLTTATYHLLMHKNDYLARLKEELESVMEDPYTRVDVRTLEQLPWLVSVFLWRKEII